MAIRKTLGGDRLGSGNNMEVEMHQWGKSTHNLSDKLKTTLAVGTVVPFFSKVVLPNDEWKVRINADVMTKPTNGPLFGSFKLQLDMYFAPFRLYIGQLHNNKLGVALAMQNVKLPLLRLKGKTLDLTKPIDNQHINPSCILSYLNYRGLGKNVSTNHVQRDVNAIPLLAYWDFVKNYLSSKQEEIGAVIHQDPILVVNNITDVEASINGASPISIPKDNEDREQFVQGFAKTTPFNLDIEYSGGAGQEPPLNGIVLIRQGSPRDKITREPVSEYFNAGTLVGTTTVRLTQAQLKVNHLSGILGWDYATAEDQNNTEPKILTFPLKNLDQIRESLLERTREAPAIVISSISSDSGVGAEPLKSLLKEIGTGASLRTSLVNNQEGLALKTYQADIFNAWLKTDFINQISTASAVAVVGNSFTIDQVNMAKKVWEHMNRLVASGGTYNDWIEVTYGVTDLKNFEIPMYLGGLSKEVVFQEVISNAEADGSPLGSLGGRGVLSGKHKGGYVELDAKEAGYLMGVVSLTPRLDYTQGNSFDMNLKTMDDLHKPQFDGIGYQDLITDQMAWWDTVTTNAGVTTFKSAGKQPAWMNYQTSYNRALGNFADDSENWMVLSRRYEFDNTTGIKDLTMYVDPKKFNHIFADANRDAQNFWVQIDTDTTVRRAMSARQIPNF